jgi:outer membrane immunogenic protein
MKKLLLGSTVFMSLAALPAFAADLSRPAPAPVYTKAPAMAPAFSWTGFYIGANGGAAWAKEQSVDITETLNGALFVNGTWPGTGNFGTLKPSGGFVGGQVGFNYQVGMGVFGVEADFQGASVKDSLSVTAPYISPPNTMTIGTSSELKWFGTARARAGVAWDRVLVYATGGFAWGKVDYNMSMTDTFGFAGAASTSTTRTGYVIGGGLEYAFTPSWTAKVEYQYMDLGSLSINFPESGGVGYAISSTQKFVYSSVRGGLNFKLGGGMY